MTPREPLPEQLRHHDCKTEDRDYAYTIECPLKQALSIAWEALDNLSRPSHLIYKDAEAAMQRIRELGK